MTTVMNTTLSAHMDASTKVDHRNLQSGTWLLMIGDMYKGGSVDLYLDDLATIDKLYDVLGDLRFEAHLAARDAVAGA